jgi:plastocyanin
VRRAKLLLTVVVLVALGLAPEARAKGTANAYAGEPDPKALPKQTELNAFYPHTVTINRGQSVRWRFTFLHTVSFLSGAAPPPLIVSDPARQYGAQNDAAGNPFWWSGLPVQRFHPIVVQRTTSAYAGRGIRTSGFPPRRSFKLRFNKTGTFTYNCLLHPGMKGRVRVVGKGKRVPSARGDARTVRRQVAADLRVLKRQIRSGGGGNGVVLLGHDRGAATLLRMVPSVLRVPVGGTVTFRLDGPREVHTATFGSDAYRQEVNREFERGTPQAPFPAIGPRGLFPSDPPPALPPFDGTNHGNGFLNTGALDPDPASPPPSEATVQFTRAGSYVYECMIHPGMKGTIIAQ